MVCEWGMSDELGPLTYGKKEEQIFLGRDIGQTRDFSEETAKEIDGAVRKIIDNAMATVTSLLEGHRDVLTLMAEELLEKETIVLSDIERMVEELHPGKYNDLMRKTSLAKPKAKPQAQPETDAKMPDEEDIIEVAEDAETPDTVVSEPSEGQPPAEDPKTADPKEQ
jgi:cell division protease FtsH